jgi:hypothetical protein
MRPLVREEIAPLEAYGALRDAFRHAVIAHKQTRRMSVGPSVTLLFEDRETLRFQVQEMLWVEHIDEPARIQHELDVYNELMPGRDELSATLFIEITEPGRIRAELDRLVGIDEHVALVLGAGPAAVSAPARFDAKQFEEERISAVQYVRFALDAAQAATLADPREPAAIRVSHPAYRHEAPIPPEVRESLATGLREEPASLLPPLPAGGDAAPEVLLETPRVRVLRAARPALPGQRIVETREPLPRSAELDPATWGELLDTLRRVAQEVFQQHGGCRVVADLVPEAVLRWHVLPLPGRPKQEDEE